MGGVFLALAEGCGLWLQQTGPSDLKVIPDGRTENMITLLYTWFYFDQNLLKVSNKTQHQFIHIYIVGIVCVSKNIATLHLDKGGKILRYLFIPGYLSLGRPGIAEGLAGMLDQSDQDKLLQQNALIECDRFSLTRFHLTADMA